MKRRNEESMRKYMPAWMAVVIAAGLLVTGGLIVLPAASADDTVSTSSALELFMDVFSRTSTTYVDPLESQELVESALRGMLESLDPNSILLDPDDYENLRIQLEGSFEGVGISIGIRDDWLTVISPIEGTPAYRGGMRAGDRIVEIDGESTRGITTEGAVMQIRGPGGTTVELTVVRPGAEDSIGFEIERDVIDLPSVSAGFMVTERTGYVRLARFGETSAEEVEEELRALIADGADNIILDLRGNSGGLFNAAVDVSDFFLPAGRLVVSTRGNAVGEHRYMTSKNELFDGGLAVLVDGGSASSSEIVAGALQDHDVAVLVGTRTFGKGSVQTLMDLGEFPNLGHYAVKLTTARYFTPDGRSIDRTLESDTIYADTTAEWGIVPDVVVEPPDAGGTLAAELFAGGHYFRFATDYVLEREITEDFWPETDVLLEFQAYLDEQGFEWEPEAFEENLHYIQRALFSEVASRVWDRETYHQRMAPHDEVVLTAISLLEEPGEAVSSQ